MIMTYNNIYDETVLSEIHVLEYCVKCNRMQEPQSNSTNGKLGLIISG